MSDIASYIDHTLLAADATAEQIETLCKEALRYGFASVCVNGYWTKLCSELLKNSAVKVCTVVGFPLGAMKSESKAFEAQEAIRDGATEIDMVLNIGALKAGAWQEVKRDLVLVRSACEGYTLKVIIETALLSDAEKRKACQLAVEAKADFVKTSTGFSSGGATLEDVALMHSVVGKQAAVKASGGVRNYESAIAMIGVGASRIGTSSGIAIVTEEKL